MELNGNIYFKRLHSLAGVFPLGFFLLAYFYLCLQSLNKDGVEEFNQTLLTIKSIPFIKLTTIFFFYVPLIYHAGFGLLRIYQGSSHVSFSGISHFRYIMQRFTGIVALFFIIYHLYQTQFSLIWMKVDLDYMEMVRIFEKPWNLWIYLLGSFCVVFHFCNGLWNALITWGITKNSFSQKTSLAFMSFLFFILFFLNFLIILNFTYHYELAPGFLNLLIEFTKSVLF